MKTVLIVDTETTGLTPSHAQLAEVGAVLYSVEYQTVLQQISSLFPVTDNPQIQVNGINPLATQQVSTSLVSEMLQLMARRADAIVAHNAAFDKQWLNFGDIPWICTYRNIDWHPHKNTDLVRLAVAHGVPVVKAHTALDDCHLLVKIFQSRDDTKELLTQALQPRYKVMALVSKEERHLAKEAGFQAVYVNSVFSHWEKELTEVEMMALSFQWKVVDTY